jgi:hypothetical protein
VKSSSSKILAADLLVRVVVLGQHPDVPEAVHQVRQRLLHLLEVCRRDLHKPEVPEHKIEIETRAGTCCKYCAKRCEVMKHMSVIYFITNYAILICHGFVIVNDYIF